MSDVKGTSREVGPLPNGSTLFVEDNQAGGRTYFSDEVGGGVVVWDTCLVSESTILAAMVEEARLVRVEFENTKER